jgi:hypothetical protein
LLRRGSGTGTFLDWTDAAEVSVVAGTAQEAHTHQLPVEAFPEGGREIATSAMNFDRQAFPPPCRILC